VDLNFQQGSPCFEGNQRRLLGDNKLLKNTLVWLLLIIPFTAGIFAFGCSAFGVPSTYRMVKHPGFAKGWIVRKEPENRNNVKYSFKVGDSTYEGEDGIGEAFSTAMPGDPVNVIYDTVDPNWSVLGNPRETLIVTVTLLALFSLLGGFFMALSLRRLFRRIR